MIIHKNIGWSPCLPFLKVKELDLIFHVLPPSNKIITSSANLDILYSWSHQCFTYLYFSSKIDLGETILTTIYTINCVPSFVIHNQSSYEHLYGSSPSTLTIKFLVIFVLFCSSLLNVPKSSLALVFVIFSWYRIELKGYRCYDPISMYLKILHYVISSELISFASLFKFPINTFYLSFFFHRLYHWLFFWNII